MIERRKDILYYDCTNYYFEMEEADNLRCYGKSKQHQPFPLVGMGLFMDYDGILLAFDIYPGNKSEQPTLKPLENKVLHDYGLDQIIVCTDAGLSSKSNRKFNDSWAPMPAVPPWLFLRLPWEGRLLSGNYFHIMISSID